MVLTPEDDMPHRKFMDWFKAVRLISLPNLPPIEFDRRYIEESRERRYQLSQALSDLGKDIKDLEERAFLRRASLERLKAHHDGT